MSSEELSFEEQADRAYQREMDDLAKAHALLEEANASDDSDTYDTARERIAEEYCGDPLEVQTVRCVQVLLSTGGPACGYHLFVDEEGEPTSGYYWYQDWWKPKRIYWLTGDQLEQVVEGYGIYVDPEPKPEQHHVSW